MAIDPEFLSLSDTYSFDVQVSLEDQHWAAALLLSPLGITVEIQGEERDGRELRIALTSSKLDSLRCQSHGVEFLLLDLTPVKSSMRALGPTSAGSSFVQAKFIVGWAFYFPSGSANNARFSAIRIESDCLGSWIGHTDTQQKIANTFFRDIKGELTAKYFPIEYHVETDTGIHFDITYSETRFSMPSDFRAGIEFPPLLSVMFPSRQSVETITRTCSALTYLLEFLFDQPARLRSIQLSRGNSPGSRPVSVYQAGHRRVHDKIGAPMIPLGANVSFDRRAPEMPTAIICTYLGADELHRERLAMLARYRTREAIEERFLGYFRLLESICHRDGTYVDPAKLDVVLRAQKEKFATAIGDARGARGLIKAVKYANRSKYSAQQSIEHFIESLAAESTQAMGDYRSHVEKICNLRNALTHARPTGVDEQEIYALTTFTEMLLVLAILTTLDVPPPTAAIYIHNVDRFHFLSQRFVNS